MREVRNDRLCGAKNRRTATSMPHPVMDRHSNQCAQRMQMEMTMLATLEFKPIALEARTVHRIDNGKGTQVTCVKGVVWVTQEHDSRDIILVAGQSLVLDRRGLAVVFAFKDALITVGAGLQLPAPASVPAP